MNLKNVSKKAMDYFDENSSKMLTGTAVAGSIMTGGLAFKSGLEMKEILDSRKEELKRVGDDPKRRKEININTFKKSIPKILPTLFSGIATAACIITSHSISSRKIAMVTAAYNISEKAVTDLNGKMKEVLGEKKTKEIRNSIIKDDIGQIPKNETIIMGSGDVWCKDKQTGRFFRSNAQKIGIAIAQLSADIQTDMWVSLNDLYDAIDSKELESIPLGDDLGWNVEDCEHGKLPISYSSILTEDGTPCLCLDYDLQLHNRRY